MAGDLGKEEKAGLARLHGTEFAFSSQRNARPMQGNEKNFISTAERTEEGRRKART